jgi:hypothetical protein
MGIKIKSLDELADAANKRKAVICPTQHCWCRPRPAAFMIHQPGIVLLGLFDFGMEIYEPSPKRENRIFTKTKK